MQRNTRVVRLDKGIPGSLLGTVVDAAGHRVVVKWDDGGFSSLNDSRVIPHQQPFEPLEGQKHGKIQLAIV